jgi:hypothetical protein
MELDRTFFPRQALGKLAPRGRFVILTKIFFLIICPLLALPIPWGDVDADDVFLAILPHDLGVKVRRLGQYVYTFKYNAQKSVPELVVSAFPQCR